MSAPIFCQKKHGTINSKLQLMDQYSRLLKNTTFFDFTFIVKGKPFKVHKNILASESETMQVMFTAQLKESVQGACIGDDIEPDIFQHMLQFIYAGIAPANLDDLSTDLYKAAHYYRIVKLMEICEQRRMDAWKIVKW